MVLLAGIASVYRYPLVRGPSMGNGEAYLHLHYFASLSALASRLDHELMPDIWIG
jgi:hypothetical protein